MNAGIDRIKHPKDGNRRSLFWVVVNHKFRGLRDSSDSEVSLSCDRFFLTRRVP
jgi:hypothetical protein